MRGFKTDKNGRWSPVHDISHEEDSNLVLWVGGVAAGILLAALLFLAV
jgi:hypothetical protein